MAKTRHDAGRRAQLAQSPAAAAFRPLDQVFIIKVLQHKRRLRCQPVGTGYHEAELLSKERPGPHALGNGAAFSQDDQIGVSFQHGVANQGFRTGLDGEFEIRLRAILGYFSSAEAAMEAATFDAMTN